MDGDRDPQVDRSLPERDDASIASVPNRRKSRRQQREAGSNGLLTAERPTNRTPVDDDAGDRTTKRGNGVTPADLKALL